MADTLETMDPAEAEGLARAIAAAGLQVSQAADDLREAAEALMQAEAKALEAETRARALEEQLAQSAVNNAELLEMVQAAREGQAESEERSRRAEDRLEQADTAARGATERLSQVEERAREDEDRLALLEGRAHDAETRARAAEEQLALSAAQNAELLGLVEAVREGQADADQRLRETDERVREADERVREADELVREADERVRAAEERARLMEEQVRELEARIQEAVGRQQVTVIVDDERTALQEAVAAEVRRPLTTILGLVLALKHVDPAGVDGKDMVRQLATSARKLDRLIGHLLDLDRIANGTFVLNRRRTNLEALVRRVIEESQDLTKRDVKVEADHVAVGVDPGIAEQIVESLLANATRRTAPGNPIWVKISSDQGGVEIAVDDTSTEVPPGLRNAMFAALSDESPTPRQTPRAPTGLSLLARLAEIHGGRAWVEERSGGGASFRVFLSESAEEGPIGEELRDRRAAAPASDPGRVDPDAREAGAGDDTFPDIKALRDLLTKK